MKDPYPKTLPGDPIVYYPFSGAPQPNYYRERCAGCGGTVTRVDSYYQFMLCDKCSPEEVGQALAEHAMGLDEPSAFSDWHLF